MELNSIYDKFLNQLRKLPLYGLKKISLKLAAFLKELTEVLTPMLSSSSHDACFNRSSENFQITGFRSIKDSSGPLKEILVAVLSG